MPPATRASFHAVAKSCVAFCAGWRKRFAHTNMQGVWVGYFLLAALPLFGLGGVLVREADLENRRQMFQLLCLYLASGLGLLSVVRLLGLRRYLRERQVEMPPWMVALWFAGSSCLIAG